MVVLDEIIQQEDSPSHGVQEESAVELDYLRPSAHLLNCVDSPEFPMQHPARSIAASPH